MHYHTTSTGAGGVGVMHKATRNKRCMRSDVIQLTFVQNIGTNKGICLIFIGLQHLLSSPSEGYCETGDLNAK
jgi:hypothetical protein